MKRFVIALSVIAALFTACSVNPGAEELDGNAAPLASVNNMIDLVKSDITNLGSTGIPYTTYVNLTGKIKVKNVAYNKKVWVHVYSVGAPVGYTRNADGWYDVQATYSGPAEAGYEYWTFTVPTTLYKGGQGSYPLFKYVLAYTVNGQTYWDNNGGLNYKDAVPVFKMVGLKSAGYWQASHPSMYTMNHILEGKILVKNVSYNKQVSVVYVGSDGQWKTAAAKYSAPDYYYGNYEVWTFNIQTPVYKYPPTDFYRFAICYKVNGVEYWDNNNGSDYRASSFNKGFTNL